MGSTNPRGAPGLTVRSVGVAIRLLKRSVAGVLGLTPRTSRGIHAPADLGYPISVDGPPFWLRGDMCRPRCQALSPGSRQMTLAGGSWAPE